jgi:hypothetical protein
MDTNASCWYLINRVEIYFSSKLLRATTIVLLVLGFIYSDVREYLVHQK